MTKRWLSEEDLAKLPSTMTRRALGGGASKKAAEVPEHLRMAGVKPPAAPKASGGKAAMQALGRMEKGKMNKTEEAYAQHLDLLRMAGEVLWFKFEPFALDLAPKTTYRPDFLVQVASGHLEVHEVKGFWEDDARVKIKVAAELFPVFKFIAIKKGDKGEGGAPGWKVEEF
ncbi:hypothetical protein [Pseudomonas sp. NPDC090208]|uniref:hypothetical protein n=1 Tax=Pseudomonas sp. NPDC090208 TaxID=3364478 RepID=UPI003830CD1B